MRIPAQPDPVDVPREHALLVVDMKGYSRIPEARMAPARSDLDSILDTAFEQSGVEMPQRVDGTFDDTGDGAIFVLPASDTTRLIDPLLGNLNAALCRYDRKSRLHSAPQIRVRSSVHVGPVSLPDRRNRAVVEACRLVDSEAVREALDAAEAHGAYLAAAVSEIAFRRTVRDGRTLDLDESHFLSAAARVNGKPEFEEPCRLLVPGVPPVLLGPSITDARGLRPSPGQAPAPARGAANSSSVVAGHRGPVLNFLAAMDHPTVIGELDTLNLDQRQR
ncbi:hypothetical protein C5F59_003285 [Streptomyces sp. QL37]|uniref:hypothetical protein n=1 Tax=Streptomyces sp. QL37 TaxID=2093747 RepID=UPI000CF2B86E|nr:hypothetical protein [Streptomyces sp. QL37]PPQ55828.1 hypothetical protein C5F59_03325 [Streptomyces sp. QL37]